MIVRQVIASKGSSNVAAVGPDMSIQDLVCELSNKNIGALLVVDPDETVLGIVSERDIVRAISDDGAVCFDCPVSKYMTNNVETTHFAENIDIVMDKMTTGRFRHMPVVEEGKLAGIISIGDIVKARISDLEMEKKALSDMISGN